MKVFGIVVCAIVGIFLFYIIGVYVYDAILRYFAAKHPPLSHDEQRSADYAAYKARI